MSKESNAAKAFAAKWQGQGAEKQQSQRFWLELMEKVLGAEHPTDLVRFEEKVKLDEGCGFDWSDISPTIFGAIFESTLNPATRRAGGMHYTSIENIHKVIDPLFLDGYRAQFAAAMQEKQPKKRLEKLRALQEELGRGRYFDPACGSGNFLTESYLSLRRLENDILRQTLMEGETGVLGFDFEGGEGFLHVTIDQFYGIEINDFAVAVCKTALWIAEAQMFAETEDIIHKQMDFLPLHTNSNIHEGNALRLDWNEVLPPSDTVKIMGVRRSLARP